MKRLKIGKAVLGIIVFMITIFILNVNIYAYTTTFAAFCRRGGLCLSKGTPFRDSTEIGHGSVRYWSAKGDIYGWKNYPEPIYGDDGEYKGERPHWKWDKIGDFQVSDSDNPNVKITNKFKSASGGSIQVRIWKGYCK